MSSVRTDPATNVTDTTARMNAYVTGWVMFPRFRYGKTVAYELGEVLGEPDAMETNTNEAFYANLTSLDDDTTYYFQAYGADPVSGTELTGEQDTFLTLHTPVAHTRSVAGNLTPSGILSTLKIVITETFYASLAGSLTPVGHAVTRQDAIGAGVLTPTGALGAVHLCTAKFTDVAIAGAVTPTGALSIVYLPSISLTDSAVDGALEPVGALGTLYLPTTSFTASSVTGALTPAGVLGAVHLQTRNFTVSAVAGGLTPSGALTTQQLTAAAAGALEPTGALATNFIGLPAHVTLAGSINPLGRIDIVFFPYSAPADVNLAALLNLIMEQGASFSREFVWIDEDGNEIALATYRLCMTIRPYRGSETIIASNVAGQKLRISKLESRGHFQVSIRSDDTASFNFTRAVYDIEAHIGYTVSRLVEGSITLTKEATSNA